MKTKIKRHSRSVLSVVLAISMLVSCMTVGIIATDAAKDDSESVGANVEFYYDFTQLTSGGYNYINASGDWSFGTDRSQIIKGSYPDNDSGKTIAKWEQGGWDSVLVKVSDIPAGKNMMIAHGDNTVTWGVYGESGGGGGGGEAGSSSWYLRNGVYGWDSNGAGSGFTYNPSTGYYEKAVTWNTGDNWFRVAKNNAQYNGAGNNKDTELSLDTWHTGLQSATNGAFNYKPAAANTSLIIQIDEKAEMSNTKVRVKTATSPVASSFL